MKLNLGLNTEQLACNHLSYSTANNFHKILKICAVSNQLFQMKISFSPTQATSSTFEILPTHHSQPGMNKDTFYDMMLCSMPKVNRRFGGTCTSIFRLKEYAKQETSMK
jgi:hypothetical protein